LSVWLQGHRVFFGIKIFDWYRKGTGRGFTLGDPHGWFGRGIINTEVGYTIIDVVAAEFQGPRALPTGPSLTFTKGGVGDKALEIDVGPGGGRGHSDSEKEEG